jgi:acetyl esterase/lipase
MTAIRSSLCVLTVLALPTLGLASPPSAAEDEELERRMTLVKWLTESQRSLKKLEGALTGEPDNSRKVETHSDIAYVTGTDADPERHKLDVYLPKGEKSPPVMMFVHGGSWRSGTKDLYGALGLTFAEQGIATVVINYRLSRAGSKVKHPDHICDVARAFAWVKSHAKEYGWDPKRIYISGHSAGGHLAALLATDKQYLEAVNCSCQDIRGVMALSGVYEITPLLVSTLKLEKTFPKDEAEGWTAMSPIHRVGKGRPPFLLAYADKDYPFLNVTAKAFGDKLKECKCDASVMKVGNRNHYTLIMRVAISADDPLTQAMISFMRKQPGERGDTPAIP